jgi:hypothetical protein
MSFTGSTRSVFARWTLGGRGGRPRRINHDDEAFIVATAAAAAARQPGQLAAHEDVAGIEEPGLRRQARSDRAGHQRVSAALFRVRPVRAVVDPPALRRVVGAAVASGPATGDLPAHARDPLLPRLLQLRRRLAVGCVAPPQRRRSHPSALRSIRGRGRTARRSTSSWTTLSANKTPAIRAWAARNRVELFFTPNQRVVRATAHLHDGRLEPPEPHRARPGTAEIPALAQRPALAVRVPGDVHRRGCVAVAGSTVRTVALQSRRRRGVGRISTANSRYRWGGCPSSLVP